MKNQTDLSRYRDLGRVVNRAEPRSSSLVKASDGKFYLVICAKGFVVTVNLHTQEVVQTMFPEGLVAYPFNSIASKNGKIYLGAGKLFMEFDPVIHTFTFWSDIHGDEVSLNAWCLTESDDGIIYFGATGKTYLTGFKPETREFIEYGVIHPEQSYLGTMAIDKAGYLYCSFGTETNCIVAVELKTGKRIPLPILKPTLPPNPYNGDSCEVYLATDGEVYGTFDGDLVAACYDPIKPWFRLYEGKLLEQKKEPFTNYILTNQYYGVHCPYPEHPEIEAPDLFERRFTYVHPDTGETVTVELPYETIGADLSPVTEGPDGKIYGTTNHPYAFYRYDPKTEETEVYSGDYVRPGNICGFAVQGDIIGGIAYCGGHLIRIDTTQPIALGWHDTNPYYEGSFNEILRPRSACAMPDGKTMIFGGYNANGITGAGVLVYDSSTRACKVIENAKMLRYHSVMAMVPLSNTLLLCGSCIEAPCGGVVKAKEAEIFLYDLETESLLYSLVPVPGARTISHMKMDKAGIIHGITNNSIYFSYDIEHRKVSCTKDLSAYGRPVRDGMKSDADGTVYGLLSGGIYRIQSGATNPEILSVPPHPIDCGMALLDGKIYFGSNRSHLWSYTIEK